MRSQEEYVLRTVEERGIRFVQLWFTDVLGTPKTFSITPAELENALERFNIHMDRFPSTDEGLKALVEPPPCYQ